MATITYYPKPNSDDETGGKPDDELDDSTPRWVIVFGLIALVVVVLVVILHLTGGGFSGLHGMPQR